MIINKTLSIIPKSPDLVLVALNPTEEAIRNQSVFSRDNGFWNVLIKSCLIKSDVIEIPLKERAKEVFLLQKSCNVKLGFADLLPFVTETDSKKVIVAKGTAIDFLINTPNIRDSRKIALLGKKVADAFVRDFPNLLSWEAIKIDSNDKYGKIGTITIESNCIEVFAMPFPINNSIPEKYKIYKRLL
jgi:hypothetical protein